MFNSIMYQSWLLLTFASMIASGLLGVVIWQQEDEDSERIALFKKAVAFAFFSIAIEILSRFLALLIHATLIPTSELILCSTGRFVECAGLWWFLLYILKIWPFNVKE